MSSPKNAHNGRATAAAAAAAAVGAQGPPEQEERHQVEHRQPVSPLWASTCAFFVVVVKAFTAFLLLFMAIANIQEYNKMRKSELIKGPYKDQLTFTKELALAQDQHEKPKDYQNALRSMMERVAQTLYSAYDNDIVVEDVLEIDQVEDISGMGQGWFDRHGRERDY
jgi:hypothetical protein